MPFLTMNLLTMPLSHGDEHTYLEFHKLQEQSAREQEFIATHQENWIHGLPQLYNVIEYEKFESTASNADYENGNRAEALFGPKVVMNKVQPENLATRLSSLASSYAEAKTSKYAKEFKNDTSSSPFSGLFHIPSFSYSYPGQKGPLNMSGYIYKAHVEYNGITYMIGGLCENSHLNLRNLGIPRSTDLSRISVELKDNLPPYVNKEMLMSPAMCENPSFLTFNPSRGTVTVYDIDVLGETSAGKLLQLYGTVVAPNCIFFCGGFQVKVDSVNYDQDIKRWIVKKSIKVNEFGYILDTVKMKMTKIHLRSKLGEVYNKRLGACLVSNTFDGISPTHLDVTLPVGESNSLAPYALQEPPVTEKEPQKVEVKREILIQKKDSTKLGSTTESTTLATSHTSTAATSRSTLRVTTDNSPHRIMTSGSSRSGKHGDINSNTSGSPLSPTASSTGNPLKVSSILQKSTRLFHRNSVRHNGLSQMRSASYSNHVKQHRAQTLQSSQNSRSTSPLRLSVKLPPPKLVADSVSLGSESTDTESLHSEQSIASSHPIATPTPKKTISNNAANLGPELESLGSGESVDCGAFFLEDSMLRSGVISVSVYQFGGFKEVMDSSGILSFIATNDLIKIELIIDDPEQVIFHSEAYTFELTGSHSNKSVWPSPRGYFAYSLVNDEPDSAYCELVRTSEFQDSESSRSLISASEAISLSEKSTGKSHHSYNADLFFERKALMIHGGVDENNEVKNDMYMFHFNTRGWLVAQTYAFDYYDLPKQPYEDENTELLTLERQVENPKLVEAELRCCHHQALLFLEDGREYVAFLGGFTNDFLRHHEKTPYTSDRFDVSRIARFLMSCTNPNLLRVPVLNLQSQTWKFSRFFYDLTGRVSPQAMDLLMGTDYLRNARMNVYGGLFSIVGKQITICHGMVEFTPEKAEDFAKVKKGLGANSILMGGHCHLIFPSL